MISGLEKHKRARGNQWARRFAAMGVMLPLVCLIMEFEPVVLLRMCEVGWLSGFLLLATEGEFNVAILLVSIALNAGMWGCVGWLIGYLACRNPSS
ncbi:hypothetical protein QCB44_05330 [Thiomicrorhabdus sp. zzn3]|uniref:hypothetical protein n=1 Tax=Thiomicrorhabdus sp. zzn3 TaxID=3039775 RepID=UPI0024366394|nr:hypothetical protein [Thiomicrorhabdus sp. zzn3]MDG6778122.1 hypothetical protein [Thiomicrorhabdus sp. zzn3]